MGSMQCPTNDLAQSHISCNVHSRTACCWHGTPPPPPPPVSLPDHFRMRMGLLLSSSPPPPPPPTCLPRPHAMHMTRSLGPGKSQHVSTWCDGTPVHPTSTLLDALVTSTSCCHANIPIAMPHPHNYPHMQHSLSSQEIEEMMSCYSNSAHVWGQTKLLV